ncbi:MFS transporter [Paenibacillus whitsoniae]|uniref:MFS transporter n=1 Tax=Paenibacillus whitsoniae TaxID=2496558 RepID=A0A3S0BY69_9BACL|nr:MFS transporter [Paenibacillus whitsoniae]RTE10931.1 MFS transporter [Paenibacillus whitsoniae]
MESKKTRDLIAIASIPLIMTLGNSMFIPVLPSIRSELKISSFQVSLLITIYSAVAILLIPIAGYFSDRFGRKKVIIPSLVLAGIGGLISGLGAWWMDQPYAIIMIGRFLQGIGAAGAFPIVIPLVGDMFKSDDEVSKGLGLIETANTFGKVLSPILGSALALVVWFLPFLAIPVLCAASLVMVVFLVKVPDDKKQQAPLPFSTFFQSLIHIFKKKGRWLYGIFAIGGICMLVIFSTLFYLSDILEDEYNLHGILKGCVLAIPLAALCLSSYLTGKVIGKNKPRMKWMNFGSIVIMTGTLILCGLGGSIFLLMVWISVCGIGIGGALPCLDAMITEGIEKEQRGSITSIYSSMRFIGVAAGPPLASVLMRASTAAMFYTISGACLIAAVLALLTIHPSKNA